MIEGTTTETLKVRWLILRCLWLYFISHWVVCIFVCALIRSTFDNKGYLISIHCNCNTEGNEYLTEVIAFCLKTYLATSLVSLKLWNLTVLNQACWISLLSTCRLDFNFIFECVIVFLLIDYMIKVIRIHFIALKREKFGTCQIFEWWFLV